MYFKILDLKKQQKQIRVFTMTAGQEKKLIREIKKREDVYLRICTGDLMGFPYVEIRQYIKDKHGFYNPTQKGINISLNHIDEIIEGLLDAKRTLQK
jgi:hypothetical protein